MNCFCSRTSQRSGLSFVNMSGGSGSHLFCCVRQPSGLRRNQRVVSVLNHHLSLCAVDSGLRVPKMPLLCKKLHLHHDVCFIASVAGSQTLLGSSLVLHSWSRSFGSGTPTEVWLMGYPWGSLWFPETGRKTDWRSERIWWGLCTVPCSDGPRPGAGKSLP